MGKKRVIKKGHENEAQDGAKIVRQTEFKGRVTRGAAHVKSTYNNVKITITDEGGNVIAWSSSGSLGFRGAKKATPFAASRVAEDVVAKVSKIGLRDIAVFVRGVGSGRDSAIRSLANHGLNILSIRDVTPLPHNGPRAKKVRRV